MSKTGWYKRMRKIIAWIGGTWIGVTVCILSVPAPPASAAGSSPPGDKRIALVIGIAKYQFAPALANPGNDARHLAEALRHVNFEVEEAYDPDYRTLGRTLREFGIRAQKADAALIFYAGHGVQVDRQNYVIPADAKLEREHDLLYEALPLDLFMGELAQARKVGILLLDACRNNPFADRMSRSLSIAGRGPVAPKGLARIDGVPRNTIVVMATRADEIAEDGDTGDSPFTQAILAHLQIPGLELGLFFRSVRDTVLKATDNRQEPYVFSSLGAEPFYFRPRPPNHPPVIGPIAELKVADTAGPTPLGLPRPTDPDDDPLTVRIIGLPHAGEIRIDGNAATRDTLVTLEKFMTATYKPDSKGKGPVGTFDFLVDDGRGGNAVGSLPITVSPTNHPPVAEAERVVRIYPSVLGIQTPTDPDGDPLTVTVTALPNRGAVRGGANTLKTGDRLRPQDLPALTYIPDSISPGDAGSLRYTVDDGRGGTAEGHVQIQIASADEPRLREPEPARLSSAKPEVAEGSSASGAMVPPRPAPAPAPLPAPDRQRPADNRVAEALPRAAPPLLSPPGSDRGGGSASFQDCPICPPMVRVPGGSFMMGQSGGDGSTAPVRRVSLKPFALGRHPVTVGEWKACVGENGCSFTPRMVKSGEAIPVHNVSWDDAQEYVAWLSKKSGKHYRLPSEAEWEYAARANTTTPYWWGREIGVFLANCSDCGGAQDRDAPLPVESFKPNAFSLFDVAGGVAQWVADCWSPTYQGAPSDGSAREQRSCQDRVLRGGSFRNTHGDVTVISRNHYDASVRYLAHGFRVAADTN